MWRIVGLAAVLGLLWGSPSRADEPYRTFVPGQSSFLTVLPCQSTDLFNIVRNGTTTYTVPCSNVLDQYWNVTWVAGQSPAGGELLSNSTTALKIIQINGHINTALGAAGAVNVAAAPNGAKCIDGGNLSAGGSTSSMNANPTIYNNGVGSNNVQLSVTMTAVQAGSTLCLQTTGTAWGTGTSVGGMQIIVQPTTAITNCTIPGSAIGTANSGQSCTQITNPSDGNSVWTLCGTGTQQICRNGVVDPPTSAVTILVYCPSCVAGAAQSPTGMWQYGSGSWYYYASAPGTSWPGWTSTNYGANDPR